MILLLFKSSLVTAAEDRRYALRRPVTTAATDDTAYARGIANRDGASANVSCSLRGRSSNACSGRPIRIKIPSSTQRVHLSADEGNESVP